jgi:hypothetical protein
MIRYLREVFSAFAPKLSLCQSVERKESEWVRQKFALLPAVVSTSASIAVKPDLHCNTLLLTSTELYTTFAHLGVVAIRQSLDELSCIGKARSFLNIFL